MRRLRVEPFELDIYQVCVLYRVVRYVEVEGGWRGGYVFAAGLVWHVGGGLRGGGRRELAFGHGFFNLVSLKVRGGRVGFENSMEQKRRDDFCTRVYPIGLTELDQLFD